MISWGGGAQVGTGGENAPSACMLKKALLMRGIHPPDNIQNVHKAYHCDSILMTVTIF